MLINLEEDVKRLNYLNDYMKTKEFYSMSRVKKDLLYRQNILLTELVQIGGQIYEHLGLEFELEEWEKEK